MAKSKAEKLEKIRTFVLEERKALGIIELAEHGLTELSSISFGEFYNLLWRKLMHMPERLWSELENPEILDGVYREVLRARN